MKTPMQELLEWVNDYPTEVPTIYKSAVIAKAKELLEKEKEVMCEFADDYQLNCFQRSAYQYYNETFNTKEK
jgi:hypothetical protein